MDFDNPDNRKYVAVTLAVLILATWLTALWIDSEKLATTGGIMLIPLIGLGIWTGIGYDEESSYEKDQRKERKRSRKDNSL